MSSKNHSFTNPPPAKMTQATDGQARLPAQIRRRCPECHRMVTLQRQFDNYYEAQCTCGNWVCGEVTQEDGKDP